MPARPTDEEMAADLAQEFDRQERLTRNTQTMNALIRGEQPDEQDQQGEDESDEPADMNARIRRAAGRPYNRQKKEQE